MIKTYLSCRVISIVKITLIIIKQASTILFSIIEINSLSSCSCKDNVYVLKIDATKMKYSQEKTYNVGNTKLENIKSIRWRKNMTSWKGFFKMKKVTVHFRICQ